MLKVTTAYVSGTARGSNVGSIVAKSGGKQLTTRVDQSHSSEWNHGNAAGALLVKLGYSADLTEVHADHTATDDGQRHTFTFAV